MKPKIKSIRSFIGAKDYQVSRNFYAKWGFREIVTSPKMSYFSDDVFGFYLQDYFIKEWVDNTMLFMEVSNLSDYWEILKGKNLDQKFEGVKLVEPTTFDWGSEGFVYDPSGILWHIGEFNK
ncbi:MAG: glyoxalase [Bacteroidota bacterium]